MKPLARLVLAVAVAACFAVPGAAAQPEPVVVGSKKFTESVVLGEVAARRLESAGVPAEHRREMGGTRILWEALLRGDLDAYPDYTGTIRLELLDGATGNLDAALAPFGVRTTPPLGFDNTYALGMNGERARALGIRTISDLARHPELVYGFSNEFMDRADGWPGLAARYGLPRRQARGLDHDLAYRGLAAGTVDVIDLYSTDAEIQYYDLQVLEDDRAFFPDYEAVILYRADLADRHPAADSALLDLAGRVTPDAMIGMNADVKIDGRSEAVVAAAWLDDTYGTATVEAIDEPTRAERLWTYTKEHLVLVGVSLAAAILAAVPLGVLAARTAAGPLILGAVGVIYTIPSLALLVFMIPLLGVGGPPAVVALFLYSLLPIVRNTHAGLVGIAPGLRESAAALGLRGWARLRYVDLPLAAPSILAGVKTSAVINIGTATLGALIGAGGYGQPILTGIRLDDTALILEGAVPAALLALAAQALFALAERVVVPRGLRL